MSERRWQYVRYMVMPKHDLVRHHLDLLDEVRELTEALTRHESKGPA